MFVGDSQLYPYRRWLRFIIVLAEGLVTGRNIQNASTYPTLFLEGFGRAEV